jgi:hypothetical protein
MNPPRLLLARSAVAGLLSLWSASAASSACGTTSLRDMVVTTQEHGAIQLASGRTVILNDVRVAAEEPGAQTFLASHAGAAVEVRLSGGAPDRWGREPAEILLSPDAARLDLAHALVARGLAIVDSDAETLCDDTLLLREEQARRARRGLWREDAAQPLEAEDAAALLARLGSFTIVEGVVRNVGERGRRTFLDFGRSWDNAFTVIVPTRLWAKVQDAGMDAATLKGRRIRIRGIMQNWRGPAIELTTVEFIEKLETRPLRP